MVPLLNRLTSTNLVLGNLHTNQPTLKFCFAEDRDIFFSQFRQIYGNEIMTNSSDETTSDLHEATRESLLPLKDYRRLDPVFQKRWHRSDHTDISKTIGQRPHILTRT